MKSLTILFFWVAAATCLFAQKEVIVKTNTGSDKAVTVDVQKSGDAERKIVVKINDGGEGKTIEWTDNGEIPADIKEQLTEHGIDIEMLEGDGDERRVMVRVDGDSEDDGEIHKKVIKIKKGGDGEVMEFEWDGEGEMPAEMKEMMEEHDIDLDMEGHGEGKHKMRKAKMKVQRDKMRSMRHREHRKGRDMKEGHKNEYRIVKIDEDGNKEVKVWSDDDEGIHEIHGEGDNIFIMKGDGGNWTSREGHRMHFGGGNHLSNAYMGAHIESADKGVRILELIKDGPADKAGLQKGDVIRRVNGARARTMDGLLNLLNYFEPNDKVELVVLRGDNERKISLTLGQRPDSMK